MIGGHYIKSWSSTQKTIALSSGEAELTAAVKSSSETIGSIQLATDWGLELEGEIYVDSTAALGVVARKGAGKLRHVRVGMLWIQERAETGELRYKKVRGTTNPADALTKSLSASDLKRYVEMLGVELKDGRANMSLEITI